MYMCINVYVCGYIFCMLNQFLKNGEEKRTQRVEYQFFSGFAKAHSWFAVGSDCVCVCAVWHYVT